MDAFSIITGAMQVAGFCAQCTVSIVKWVGEVRTVDKRIQDFCEEVTTLQSTYESLAKSLRSPQLANAAQSSSKNPDGAHLWSQLQKALQESENTMRRVNLVLDEINSAHGFARTVKKQLLESLRNGELSRLRQRIVIYNSNLSFPIQMMTILLQVEQRGTTQENHAHLDAKITSLDTKMRQLIMSLDSPDQSLSLSSPTLIGSSSEDLQQVTELRHFARDFLSSASAAASTKAVSSVREDSSVVFPSQLSQGMPFQDEQRQRIDSWIGERPPSEKGSSTAPTYPTEDVSDDTESDDDSDMEFDLTRRYLTNGQAKADQDNHEAAEKNFRKALGSLANHDFGDRLAHQPADVVLMLSECCVKQRKLDEAIALLLPVADCSDNVFPQDCASTSSKRSASSSRPGRLHALAAHHMLGMAYLERGQPDKAVESARKAFKGRRKQLKGQHPKTLDSLELLIMIYRAQGDEEEAEAHEEFKRPRDSSISLDDHAPRPIPNNFNVTSHPTTISPPAEHTSPIPTTRQTSSDRWWKLRSKSTELSEKPLSRQTTLNERGPIASPPLPIHSRDFRTLSMTSGGSTPERPDSTTSGTLPPLDRSFSSQPLETPFEAVRQLCVEKNYNKAVKRGMTFLESYPSRAMIIRSQELEKNIKRSGTLGLAGTGHGYAPLHFFVEIHEPELIDEVEVLIRQGVDVNAVMYKAGYTSGTLGSNPLTALQIAVREDHQNITRHLLNSPRINPNVRDVDGYTPLLRACREGHHNIVTQLLNHPSQNLSDTLPNTWHGNTLLHDSARNCDPELVSILLQRPHLFNNDINTKDKFGRTPLILAVIKRDIMNPDERSKKSGPKRLRTIRLLLDAGADTTIKDNGGFNAGDYAREEELEKSSNGAAGLVDLVDPSARRGNMADNLGVELAA